MDAYILIWILGILKITPHDVIGQQVTDIGVADIDTLENCQCHVGWSWESLGDPLQKNFEHVDHDEKSRRK
jgi:hypothetical protein